MQLRLHLQSSTSNNTSTSTSTSTVPPPPPNLQPLHNHTPPAPLRKSQPSPLPGEPAQPTLHKEPAGPTPKGASPAHSAKEPAGPTPGGASPAHSLHVRYAVIIQLSYIHLYSAHVTCTQHHTYTYSTYIIYHQVPCVVQMPHPPDTPQETQIHMQP